MNEKQKAIAESIVAEIERGTLPWLKPWKEGVGGTAARVDMPRNAVSGRSYSGINVFMLWAESMHRGYSAGRWLTYKQAIGLGGHVRKGETGTHIFFLAKVPKKVRNESGDEEMRQISLMRTYVVFNVAQCDGLPDRVTQGKPLPPAPELDATYSNFVALTQARITRGGDRACYIPSIDAIQMPHLQAFRDLNNYKATECHELIHWTGAKHRLARDFSGRFGDSSYAFEELIAEIGAAFICAELGVVGDLRHAAYVANWLKVIKDNPQAIFTAASQASKAAEYLLAFSRQSAEESDEMEQAA